MSADGLTLGPSDLPVAARKDQTPFLYNLKFFYSYEIETYSRAVINPYAVFVFGPKTLRVKGSCFTCLLFLYKSFGPDWAQLVIHGPC